MKRQLDIDKINDLLWKLKQVVLCEPEQEASIAINRFIKFSRNKQVWADYGQDHEDEQTINKSI